MGLSLITIVIPCYNQARYLGEAIESVLAQSYPHFEIVVVDDGSSDNTSGVAARYPSVQCIQQDNQGLAAARNAGLKESHGDYLVFLDADDRLLPNALEAGLAEFQVHPDCAFVAGHHRLIGADGSLIKEIPPHQIVRQHYAELLRRNYIAMHAAVIYRRDVLDSVCGFNTSLKACEDYDLYLRIARQWPIHCHDGVVAEYRQHGDNMTQNPALMLDCALKVLRSQWPMVQGTAAYEEAYQAGMRYWRGYYSAQAAKQRDILTTMEVLDVELCEILDEQLWGRNLEAPKQGSQDKGGMLEIIGWVLGREAPAIAVEVAIEDELCERTLLNIYRQDVEAYFPQAAVEGYSGFHTWINVSGMGKRELSVCAVLGNQTRVPIARIRVRRCWRRNSERKGAPLISVIIPCYNQARFLAPAIESVLTQSYPNFEIVVIDDGSTDNTEEVATGYVPVRCFRQENQGLAAARNAGLRRSRGDYLVFLDADDRLLPEAFEAGLAAFEGHPECAFVVGNYRVIGRDASLLDALSQHPVTCDYYSELLKHNFIRVPAAVMYRSGVFRSVGDFDTSVSPCADYDIYLRMTRRFPIRCHEHVVAEYRQHSENMTLNPSLMLNSVLRVHRSQRREIRGRREYKEAYKTGRRVWQDYYGERLVNQVGARFRRGEWRQLSKDLQVLLRNYPKGLLSLASSYSAWRRVREIVRAALPFNAIVVIVCTRAGDSKRLNLRKYKVWEFVLKADSGHVAVVESVQRLEQMRGKGARFLLVPNTSFWILQSEQEFQLQLEERYTRIWCDERCIIYNLTGSEAEIVECRARDAYGSAA